MFKDFYKGSTIIFAGLLIGKLFAMASNVLMARLLNANYFGLFLLGLTVFNFISIPSNFGVPGIMPKFISEANSKKEYANLAYYASQGLLLTFMFSVILMIAVLFLSEWISNSFFHSAELIPVIRILAFAVPFNALIAVIISIHRGLENNYSKVILQDILLPVLKCLLFIVLFYFGLHLNAACYSFLSTNVIIFFISLFTILSVSHIKFKKF
jgi:O-antigen/teichoic acid export membrane protein